MASAAIVACQKEATQPQTSSRTVENGKLGYGYSPNAEAPGAGAWEQNGGIGQTTTVEVHRDSMEDGNLGDPWFGLRYCNAVHIDAYKRGNTITAIAHGPEGFWRYRRFVDVGTVSKVYNEKGFLIMEVPIGDTLVGRPDCSQTGGRRKGEGFWDCYDRNVYHFPCDALSRAIDALNPRVKMFAAAIACGFFEDPMEKMSQELSENLKIAHFHDLSTNQVFDGNCR